MPSMEHSTLPSNGTGGGRTGKVGVAVIGCGYWGLKLVRNLADNSGFSLVAVCDKDMRRLAPLRDRYPCAARTSDIKEVLGDGRVDAVVIATPATTHYRLAKQALEKGKHVMVEKPLAVSSREAQALVSLARKRRRVLLTGHTYLYSPWVVQVKKCLSRRALGRVYTVDFWRAGKNPNPDVDVFWDLAPHDISIALYWLGRRPISVRAEARGFGSNGLKEAGLISMDFPGGIWVRSHVSWLSCVKIRLSNIVGSQGILAWDDADSSEVVKMYGAQKIPAPGIPLSEPLSLECADFLRSIKTGAPPRSGVEFGLHVVRVIDAARKSLELNGLPVRP